MGIIHLKVRHYAIATEFFQRALQFANKIIEKFEEIEEPLHIINASRQSEIFYNLGVALLHLQRPDDAFDCFTVPLEHYHNNPRLWLRIAEACIMAHEQKLKESEKKGVIASVIGSGMHRKYLLQPNRIIHEWYV